MRESCFGKGIRKLLAGDADVGNVGFELGEFGASEDEMKMPVMGDWRMFGSLREETDGSVLTASPLDEVSVAFSE